MLTQDIPMKDVNKILYGDEIQTEELENNPTPQAERANQPEQRLLKKRGLKDFTLEKRPYYKRPIVQFGFVLLIGFPITWLFLSAFNPGNDAQPEQEDNPLEQENEQLKDSLAQARQEIDALTVAKGLENQEIELIEPEPEPQPEPTPEPEPQKISQPSPPVSQPRSQPVVYRQAVQTTPAISQPISQPTVIERSEPEIDPMEKWLAQAQRGYSVSSYQNFGGENNSSIASRPSPTIKPKITQKREFSGLVAASDVKSTTHHQTPLLDKSHLHQRIENQSLLQKREIRARLNQGQAILTSGNGVIATSSNLEASGLLMPTLSQNPVPSSSYSPNRLLDVGSIAKGRIDESIAWTTQTQSAKGQKYIIYLEEGLKNSGGIEVLPKGTRLIAQIKDVYSSGLFSMQVIDIIKSFNQPKISVPPGTIEIVSEDGSPLRAELKQKKSSDFLTDAGAIVAPGIERALDSTDSLLLNNGDSSIIQTSDRNPLTSGISGVASGAADVLSNRMRNRSSRNNAVPYFQFKGDQTVYVRVNEDFLLP